MLNNSSEKLFEDLASYTKDDFVSIVLLDRLFKAKAEDVDKILKEYDLPLGLKEQIKEIIFLQEPCPAYLVLDKSMTNKMQSISFLGKWSFPKAYVMKYRNSPQDKVIGDLQRIFFLSLEDAQNIYNEVALSESSIEKNEVLSQRWMFDPHLAEGYEDEGLVYFDNGAILNLDNLGAKVFLSRKRKYETIKDVFFFDGQELIHKRYEDAENDWCGFFYKEDVLLEETSDLDQEQKPAYKSIGLTKELATSLFVRLYFTKGKGLRFFEPLIAYDEAGLYAFRIKWEEYK